MSTINRKAIRAKVRRRIRRKVSGTASRPRLAVYFSNRHVYAQIIDDTVGKTICSASTADASIADRFQTRQLRYRYQGGQSDRRTREGCQCH